MTGNPPLGWQGCFDENDVLDYVAGAVDGERAAAVERHAEGCASCRRVLSELGRGLADDTASLRPGGRVGRYLLRQPVGAGAMGVVFLAYDPELDRNVALKVLAERSAGGAHAPAGRLRAEAQAMAQVSHPNLIAVFDVGTWRGRVFLAMEYVDGEPLSAWLRARRRPWRDVVRVFVAAGQGLAAAHRAGIVHRDFKPDNVLVDREGRPRVGDFGLAWVAPRRAAPGPGAAAPGGELLGTPAFMAPEQRRGAPTDARSDQYSFCLALHEALYGPARGRLGLAAGSGPLTPAEPAEPAEPAAGAAARRSRFERPPRWLRRVLLRGLSERPEARYPSMDALLRALAPRRRTGLALAASSAASALIMAGLMLAARPREAPCAEADRTLGGAWDATHKAAMRDAMLASGAPFARDAWREVERRLDRYAGEWAAQRGELCRASAAGAAPPEARARGQLECLESKLTDARALVVELTSSDPKRLVSSPFGIDALPNLSECRDEAAAARYARPAADGAGRDRAADLRRGLAEARAAAATGRPAEAVAMTERALAGARAAGAPELEVEALAQLGSQHLQLDADPAAAAAALHEGYELAEARQMDIVKAQVACDLAWLWGCQRHDVDAGLTWARLALAIDRRLGGSELREAAIDRTTGSVLDCAQRYDEAARYYEQAIARQERLGLPGARRGLTLLNLALLRREQGRRDQARALYDQAGTVLADAVGTSHPWFGHVLRERGMFLLGEGHYEEAGGLFERALAIYAPIYPPTASLHAAARQGACIVRVRLGHAAEALDCQRAQLDALAAVAEPDPSTLANALWGMALLLVEAGRAAEALPAVDRSLAVLAQSGQPPDLASALAEAVRGRALLALGRRRQAVAPLERALALHERVRLPATELPRAQFDLARALGRRDPRARDLAARASDGFAALPSALDRRHAAAAAAWAGGRGR
ncbi:MAG TPA: serine/threonine-protein kinase [Polyangiaceae bacterium]|nr:serine/threonine-protein kinase [Polyangiaceae bacterium]